MAENLPSASPLDEQEAPGLRLAPAVPDVVRVGDAVPTAGRRPWQSTCTGKVTWMTLPDREVSECVLARGHRGDHRDAAGYPWNEARWAD